MSTSCNHCFCRSKTVADDAFAAVKRRVFYCCWCGEEKGPTGPPKYASTKTPGLRQEEPWQEQST